MRSCENCGIPEGACTTPGESLTLKFMPRPGEKWKMQHRRTVWVCGSACALQARAIAAMGLPTHKWPMTLKEFASQLAATEQLPRLHLAKTDPSAVQTPSQTYENRQCLRGSEGAHFRIMALPYGEGVCDAKSTRKGGRPRVANPRAGAARMRRYRERLKSSNLTV